MQKLLSLGLHFYSSCLPSSIFTAKRKGQRDWLVRKRKVRHRIKEVWNILIINASPSFCGINRVIGLHFRTNSMIKEINIEKESERERGWGKRLEEETKSLEQTMSKRKRIGWNFRPTKILAFIHFERRKRSLFPGLLGSPGSFVY